MLKLGYMGFVKASFRYRENKLMLQNGIENNERGLLNDELKNGILGFIDRENSISIFGYKWATTLD